MFDVTKSILLIALAFASNRVIQAESAPELPGAMINSPPLTLAGLRGKVVVMYFYEEECPTCRKAWPERLKTAAKYDGQPVIFVAVNSGNTASEISTYLKGVSCNWPAIVDADRSFEQTVIGNQISLSNIIQVRIVTPEGKITNANFGDPSNQIDAALKTAKWKIHPSEVPDALKTAWQMIEIGNYNQGAAALTSAHKSVKDEAGKAMAAKLKSTITSEFQKLVEPASKAEEAGEAWVAYKGYQAAVTQFSSLPEAKELKGKLTKLAKEKAVLREQKGAKMWLEAKQIVNSGNSATQKRGMQLAQQVSRDYADTEAGKAATEALAQAEAGSK